VPPGYPLSTLHQARQRAVESAERRVAQGLRACDLARQRESEVESKLAQVRQQLVAFGQALLAQAEAGSITALDLQVAEQHRNAVQRGLERLIIELDAAKRTVTEKQSELSRARNEAEVARQELAVVERHRSRFDEELNKAAELSDEEQSDEAWLAHRSQSPTSGSR
jgi:hypothetical protein